MLREGIPAFRLPREVIDHDVAMIRAVGVEFVSLARIGDKASLRSLVGDGAAAVVATGAWKDVPLGVPGEDASGCYRCLEFLGRVNSGRAPDLSGTVVVVGGGNAAMDAARSALRLNPGRVIVAYRRSRDEMTAAAGEVEDALREGVEIHYLVAPTRMIVTEGRIQGLEMIRMRLGAPDATGRARPEPVVGSAFRLGAQVVIPAIGQVPEVSFVDTATGSAQGRLVCDARGMLAGYEGVFGAGDAVTGPSTVVEALASGIEAARRVIRYLEGEG